MKNNVNISEISKRYTLVFQILAWMFSFLTLETLDVVLLQVHEKVGISKISIAFAKLQLGFLCPDKNSFGQKKLLKLFWVKVPSGLVHLLQLREKFLSLSAKYEKSYHFPNLMVRKNFFTLSLLPSATTITLLYMWQLSDKNMVNLKMLLLILRFEITVSFVWMLAAQL